jgi:hypothetical protein
MSDAGPAGPPKGSSSDQRRQSDTLNIKDGSLMDEVVKACRPTQAKNPSSNPLTAFGLADDDESQGSGIDGATAVKRRGSSDVGSDAWRELENAFDPQSEKEIEYAELESRLRKYFLDLVKPTIKKLTKMEHMVKGLGEQVEKSLQSLTGLKALDVRVERHEAMLNDLRSDQVQLKQDQQTCFQQISHDMTSMSGDISHNRYLIERESSGMRAVQRTNDRCVEELQKLHEENAADRREADDRYRQYQKMLSNARTDLEVKYCELEARLHRLSDELWGETTGLTQVTRDLRKADERIDVLAKETARLDGAKASVSSMSALQDETKQSIVESDSTVKVLQTTVDTLIGDVKQHFSTATNTMAAHTASMLSEVRGSYESELGKAKQLRDDVTIFMAETKDKIAGLGSRIENTGNKSEAHIMKLVHDLEEHGQIQKRNQSNNLLELKAMQSNVHNANDAAQAVGSCLASLSSVMRMILESERVASAVAIQDETDRSKVALIGYTSAKDGGKAIVPSSRPTSRRSNGSRPQSGGGAVRGNLPFVSKGACCPSPVRAPTPSTWDSEATIDEEPPISLDQRCISCSSGAGEHKPLLAAFKMACLRYEAGPVSYAKKVYARSDLMNLRDRLLAEAESALINGTNDTQTIGSAQHLADMHVVETFEPSRTPDPRVDALEDTASESTRVPSRPESAASRVAGIGIKPIPQRHVRPASSGPTRRRTTSVEESSPLG